ncbi:MAG: site-2 protease family protein [Crocinitomicaceae bacterium]|nr:site-2 protease family protein [Crocinitomicaceae bacterium]
MNDSDLYPQKPELVEKENKTNWAATVFSIVLFILVFLFLFSNEINFILSLVLVLIIHELGHFSMMKLFRYKNVKMFFIPLMGAFVHGKKDEYSQKEGLLVVSAGPFPGIIIGFVLMLISQHWNSPFTFQFGALFFILNIINLVPLDPLDGGLLFKLLVSKNQERFLMIFSFISSLLIIGAGFMFNSFLMMLFGFFMGFRVRALQKNVQLHKELKDENIHYNTTYKALSNKDFWRIKQIIVENTPTLKKYIEYAEQEEADSLLASQVNSILITPVKQDANWFQKTAVVLLWIAALASPFLFYYLIDLNWVQYAVSNW